MTAIQSVPRFAGVYAIQTRRNTPDGKPIPLTDALRRAAPFKYISPYAYLDVECRQALKEVVNDDQFGKIAPNSHGELFYITDDYFGNHPAILASAASPQGYLDSFLSQQNPHGTLVWKDRGKVTYQANEPR